LYTTKEETTRFTDRRQAALQDRSPTSLKEATVDGQRSQTGSVAPDVIEGDCGEVKAPEERQPAAEYS